MNSAYFTNYSLSKRKQPSLMRPEDEEYIKTLTAPPSITADDILGTSQPDNAVKGVSGLNLDTSRTQAIQDMYGLNDTSTEPQPTPSKSGGSGMGTEDWISMGLQAAGAMKADREAESQMKRDEELLRQQQAIAGRGSQQQAQQFQEQMQAQKRNQNMQGLQFLANQRADAMKNRTAFSFRNNFAKALRG